MHPESRFGKLLAPTSAMMWGLQFAFLNPVLGLLLIGLYQATASQVGLILAAYSAVGFVTQLLVPLYADRRHDYLGPMLLASVLTLGLVVVLGLSTTLTPAAIGLLVLGGPAGIGMSMIFAHLAHTGATPQRMVNVRAVFSAAWVGGPPFATLVMGTLGNRAILVPLAAVAVLAAITTLLMMAQRRAVTDEPPPAPSTSHGWSRAGIAVVVGVFVLLQATNTAAVSCMTLLVSQRFGMDVVWGGLALGLAAGLEIPWMMMLGRMLDRVPTTYLLAGGCVAGVVYYALVGFASNPIALMALQVLNAAFVAVIAGVGLTWFQSVIPGSAMASSVYSNSNRVGSIVAGPLIAIADLTTLQFSGVYLASAVITLFSLLVILVLARKSTKPATEPEPTPEPDVAA